ncbi:(Fe-S)-binding protein [Rhodoligotrophos defluvii]|uniref:(Fe-S)-binding protein n=1 Tax=Rhodoligotrophos defluvii TaxID=2561934 RepID=UPI0010CA0493|nr:(Fe-S)-binding protein [Rhodoligotrophos defluvii]
MVARPPHVGLFVTCLIDLFRPSVGFAAVKLLEWSGCEVDAPAAQTCCGQPAYNSGDRADTRAIARQVIELFAPYDYVVVPSGSCAGMLHKHYPSLFAAGTAERQAAEALAEKSWELVSFLTHVMGVEAVPSAFEGRVTYHDSCSGLRELGIHREPRQLLQTVRGLELVEMRDSEVCCGFGGTFCVKYPDISNDMVEKKAANIEATRADLLLAGDLGCLMNMAGKLKRRGAPIAVRHVAEVLAQELSAPAIGEKPSSAKEPAT